jgi:peptide deformylase
MQPISELRIIHFPHPTLRYQAKPLRRVDAKIGEIARHMFDLMYEHRGVGLAATQIGLPLRLFVMNPSGKADEGPEIVMLNPVISRPRGSEAAEEGCLSLPNIHGTVIRSKTIRVNAYGLDGTEIDQDFSGYEARIIQHETDHLNGVLFIDRLKEGATSELKREIDVLQTDFESRQRTGSLPGNDQLQSQALSWESHYC